MSKQKRVIIKVWRGLVDSVVSDVPLEVYVRDMDAEEVGEAGGIESCSVLIGHKQVDRELAEAGG